jgi:hypothetical protein
VFYFISLIKSLSIFIPIISPLSFLPPHTIFDFIYVFFHLSPRVLILFHPLFDVDKERKSHRRVSQRRKALLAHGEWNKGFQLPEVTLCIEEVPRVEDVWLLKIMWITDRAHDRINGGVLRGHQNQEDINKAWLNPLCYIHN